MARQELVPGREVAASAAGEERALLGERPLVAAEIAEQRRLEVDEPAIQEAAPDRRRAGDELGLGRRPRERREDREMLGERRPLFVERAVAAARADPDRQAPRRLPTDRRGDEEALGTSANAGRELRGAEAARSRGEVDRLEQAGLSGAVRAQQQHAPGRRRPVELAEVAKVAEAEVLERGGPRQMRIGMMMQT